MSVEFRVDPQTKSLVKVTEAATTPDELRVELQATADEAQNRLNAANEAKAQADANLVAATDAVDAAEAEVAAATDAVKSSGAQLGDLDAAVGVLAELAGATPEGENAEDAGTEPAEADTAVDETAEATPESEEVAIPVKTADVAPA